MEQLCSAHFLFFWLIVADPFLVTLISVSLWELFEIKVVHAGPWVVPEILACRLATIQSPVYQCNSPHILHTKLRTANYVVLL